MSDWTTNEARQRVKNFTEEQAQERAYHLAERRANRDNVIKVLDEQNKEDIQEVRAMLENFPCLRLGVKKS